MMYQKKSLLVALIALNVASIICAMADEPHEHLQEPHTQEYVDYGRTDDISFIHPASVDTPHIAQQDLDVVHDDIEASAELEDYLVAEESDEDHLTSMNVRGAPTEPLRINDVIIQGANTIAPESILSLVSYRKGDWYDASKRREVLMNIYHGVKRLKNVQLYGQLVSDDAINVIVQIEEKTPVKEIVFVGNDHLATKDIEKELKTDRIQALDSTDLPAIAQSIKKMYLEKGYKNVAIQTDYQVDESGIAAVQFAITEGPVSLVKKIRFIGNTRVTSKDLRGILLTKEDWVLGFLDRSGSYHPERIMYGDKQQIEHFYQNSGFLHAKVTNITTDIDEQTHDITLTFEIDEGEPYTIASVAVYDGDEPVDDVIVQQLGVRAGMPYSREAIANTIKQLEALWANRGYIFTHVDPTIIPDEQDKSVALTFTVAKGDQVLLNRITIRGNKKTRDKIIRRKITLREGDFLSQAAVKQSEYGIASLGYFDQRDGVNAIIKRVDKETADVDFVVKEAKTGNFGLEFGFGGAGASLTSPVSGLSVKGVLSDYNFLGSGTNLNTSATWAKDEQTLLFHLAQPWLFDKPILGAFDVYHRRPTYSDLVNVDGAINEKVTGAAVSAGIITQSVYEWFRETHIMTTLGVDSIKYQRQPKARFEADVFQPILDKAFTPGNVAWLSATVDRDMRNHPMHPSAGYQWKIVSKAGIPSFGDPIGYYKVTLDANWYTSLIQEYKLVLRVHTFFGVAVPFKNRVIPFGELFHIGGDNSVRGFLYGQIGPTFLGDTIGAKKAFFINTELIFPITEDYSMKAVLFYDGGAGWDNPYICQPSPSFRGNNFDYRHSVGIGVRLLRPMPIRVDWGFKLDPRSNRRDKRNGESASELHFGMSYDF